MPRSVCTSEPLLTLAVLTLVFTGNLPAQRIVLFIHTAYAFLYGAIIAIALLAIIVNDRALVETFKKKGEKLPDSLTGRFFWIVPTSVLVRLLAFVGAAYWFSALMAGFYLVGYVFLRFGLVDVFETAKKELAAEREES